MLQRFGVCLFAFNLISSLSYATGIHSFKVGSGHNYELPSNDPQTITNFLPWNIKAECQLVTKDEITTLTIRPLNNKGCSLNDMPVQMGQGISLSVKNGSSFIITANKGVTVEFTNHGHQMLKALCSTQQPN
jgi:hypothetical protein